jgi:ribosomal protein L37AE/L43A
MRDIWEGTIKCPKCSKPMEKRAVKIDGDSVRSWRCSRCDEELLHPGDAQKVLLKNKLKRGIAVKIGKVGRRLVVTIPKEIAEFLSMEKGRTVVAKIADERKVTFELA